MFWSEFCKGEREVAEGRGRWGFRRSLKGIVESFYFDVRGLGFYIFVLVGY